MELGVQLEHWHWWVLGLAMVVIEALMPSGLWAAMAVASVLVGVAAWIIEGLSWQFQLGLFASLLLIFLLIISQVKKWLPKSKNDDGTDSLKAKDFIGKDIILTGPIKNGFGELEINDTWWSVKGPDLKKGTKVRVIGTDAGMLSVLPLTIKNDHHSNAAKRES